MGVLLIPQRSLSPIAFQTRNLPKRYQDLVKDTVASDLLLLARDLYTLGVDTQGNPYCVANDGPNVALRLDSREFRSQLAYRFNREVPGERVATTKVLADAVEVLEGEARGSEPRDLPLRVGRDGNGDIVIDIGDREGRAIILNHKGWHIVNRSPITFARTRIMGTLPEPSEAGSLVALRRVLNVTEETWPLVVGWLIAALTPDIPHPILFLIGEQGTAKSTAARFLLNLIDPSPAALRATPRNPDDWAVTAAGSWAFGIDNLTKIEPWLSDALCRAVTGDSWVKRTLYTDSELTALTYQRVMVMTAIDPGAVRGDLADRLVTIQLEAIPAGERKSLRDTDDDYNWSRASSLGALLDLLVEVEGTRPLIHVDTGGRMSDFEPVLMALDKVTGWHSLKSYSDSRDDQSQEVVESDPVGRAVLKLMESRYEWRGTATELLRELRNVAGEDVFDLPSLPNRLSGSLRRVAPLLRAIGVDVVLPTGHHKKAIALRRKPDADFPLPTRDDGDDGDGSYTEF